VDALTPEQSRRRTRPPDRVTGEEFVRKRSTILAVCVAIGVSTFSAWAELGSNMPSDAQLVARRAHEGGSSGLGIFDIVVPPPGTMLHPVKRVPRDQFGVVGPFR
jgi:hypothetical protein